MGGLAQFQMIVPPGGPPHVIDFNGRFYASLESAMAAGVNFRSSGPSWLLASVEVGGGSRANRVSGTSGWKGTCPGRSESAEAG